MAMYQSQFTGQEIDDRLTMAANAVQYVPQTLSSDQKAQARSNIDAPSNSDLNDKEDKVQGKGLSTNDYTNEAKALVDALPVAIQNLQESIAVKYAKPSGGIPASDLSSGVQESLEKADGAVRFNAIQSLTAAQKAQVRANIDAASLEDVTALNDAEFIVAWDGASTPVVANIPAGVTVTYNTTTYTGTLAASASTAGNIYLVKNSSNYDMYVSTASGSSYSWVGIGSTALDLSGYATTAQVSQLEAEIFKIEAENTETIPAGYDYTTILSNLLMVPGITYTINASVTVNPQNVYVKITDLSGTELFRISMNGTTVLTGQYVYTPNSVVRVNILAAAPAGSTTVTVTVTDNKVSLEERVDDIEKWIESKNEGKEITLDNIEFGGMTSNGVPRSVSADFYSFFTHFRSGRLIKTNYLSITNPGIMGCVYTFSDAFTKQREIPFVDSAEVTLSSGTEAYLSIAFSNYTSLNSRKQKGYINSSGADDNTQGCRLSGYFSYDEVRRIIMVCGFTPMRVYIHCYDSDHTWIKRFNYEVSSSIIDLSNTSLTDFPSNGVYFRVALLKSWEALSDAEWDSVSVGMASVSDFLPEVSARVSADFSYEFLPRLDATTLNFLYKTVPHNGLRYSEEFVNEEYIKDGDFFSSCILMLPKNYSKDGKPVRLIIWCPGTGGFSGWQRDDFYPSHTKDEMEYLSSEGFAVASFLGATSKYIGGSWWYSLNDFGLPTSIDAHIQGYNYLCNKYNIAKDGCFVAGKSLGGLTAVQLLTTRRIPVLACCPLAPKLNSFPTSLTMDNYFPSVEMYAEEFQFDDGWEQFFDGSAYTEEEKNTYMKSQLRKVMGFIPMINGIVGKTFDELWTLARYGVDNQSIGECSRFVETPIRIYISVEDEAVSYNLAKNYIKSLQNGGSPAELRSLPAPVEGESGHAMVDTAPHAPRVASVTAMDGTVFTDMALTFVEMVQFFREHDKTTN